jgi:predicted transposase YdaD
LRNFLFSPFSFFLIPFWVKEGRKEGRKEERKEGRKEGRQAGRQAGRLRCSSNNSVHA